ncbi:hypothetical protein [Candidatus Solirubrobacter pratensis]|uniref:hypothetical protein n=1 Tax=Candidatus Solirubrobacter pratensis TaxID=1298857 RepID=UPI0003F9A69A|nr:hypothetical protein [Candidatus Solirubrobacter pratensis]
MPERVHGPAPPLAEPGSAPAPSGPLTTAEHVIALSRTAGNQAVVRILAREPAARVDEASSSPSR